MLPALIALIYIIRYWNYPSAPLSDIISPIVTLVMAKTIFESTLTFPTSLLILSLCIDSYADYIMDSSNLRKPMIWFSSGHLFRQLIFVTVTWEISSMILYFFTLMAFMYMSTERGEFMFFVSYVSILFMSFLQSSFDWGYICFILSDLIIAYDSFINNLHPRQFRVILVPVLYWTAEYILTRSLLNLLDQSS